MVARWSSACVGVSIIAVGVAEVSAMVGWCASGLVEDLGWSIVVMEFLHFLGGALFLTSFFFLFSSTVIKFLLENDMDEDIRKVKSALFCLIWDMLCND